jgi:hypothetical protein
MHNRTVENASTMFADQFGNLFGAATLLWRGQYERTPGTERFNFAGQVT